MLWVEGAPQSQSCFWDDWKQNKTIRNLINSNWEKNKRKVNFKCWMLAWWIYCQLLGENEILGRAINTATNCIGAHTHPHIILEHTHSNKLYWSTHTATHYTYMSTQLSHKMPNFMALSIMLSLSITLPLERQKKKKSTNNAFFKKRPQQTADFVLNFIRYKYFQQCYVMFI